MTAARRLRFDALARYLQEVAEDDLTDSGWDEPVDWLVRRVTLAIRGYPGYGETVRLTTFCSATGPRWAERTTTVARSGDDLMQARAVWVAVGRADGRPAPLDAAFQHRYGAAAQGRTVSARLSHPGPDGWPDQGALTRRAWPLRASDFDTAGHVNNSIDWAAVEDVLAEQDWAPASAELEYHHPVLPGQDPMLVTGHSGSQLRVWLLHGTGRLASAVLDR